VSWFAPTIEPLRLTMGDLEAMTGDEVEHRLAYGRAPIRSMADFRDWIMSVRHENRDTWWLRLTSDEFAHILNEVGRYWTWPTGARPSDVPPEGRYVGQMHGVHLIEDSEP
jgi:hypothetical protein